MGQLAGVWCDGPRAWPALASHTTNAAPMNTTVTTLIDAPVNEVSRLYHQPEAIRVWNTACSDSPSGIASVGWRLRRSLPACARP